MNYRHLWLENGASTLSMAIKVTCLHFTCRLLPTLVVVSFDVIIVIMIVVVTAKVVTAIATVITIVDIDVVIYIIIHITGRCFLDPHLYIYVISQQ